MKKEKWTISNIPDLSGKIIIVTGGNSGLGYESVKAFVQNGAEVILTSRTIEKGEAAKLEIMKHNPKGKIAVMVLDLMDLSSVNKFAIEFKEKYQSLDILMNNAGIMMKPYNLSKDGYESQMATNHLGHFALTLLLVDILRKTPDSRVVTVSSIAHKSAKINFDNLFYQNGKEYSPMKAYRRSKLANLLFTYQLQKYFELNKINCIAVAAHPGVSFTNLANHLVGNFLYRLFSPLIKRVLQTPAAGALPQIRAAVDTNVKAGEYYGPSGFKESRGYPVLVKSNKISHNKEYAQKLWDESVRVTGVGCDKIN